MTTTGVLARRVEQAHMKLARAKARLAKTEAEAAKSEYLATYFDFDRSRAPRTRAKYIWTRDGGLCVYCGAIGQHIDHVVPCKHKGPSIPGNLVLACVSCNMKKKGRLDLSFIVKGFQHLARVGESLEWADEFWTGDGRFFT